MKRLDLDGQSLEDVANIMAEAGPNSSVDQLCRSEFLLRQTLRLERSARADERTSVAAVETAEHTSKYTKYMLWSVIVLLASVLFSMTLSMVQIYEGPSRLSRRQPQQGVPEGLAAGSLSTSRTSTQPRDGNTPQGTDSLQKLRAPQVPALRTELAASAGGEGGAVPQSSTCSRAKSHPRRRKPTKQ